MCDGDGFMQSTLNRANRSSMITRSRFGYTETVERISEAVTGAGNTIFAKIDQAAAAKGVGMTLRPTTLLVFGNPKGGTPLMDAFPEFALELPLKVLIWDDNGTVNVAHADMAALAKRYGVSGKDQIVAAMDHALTAMAASVSS
jgi:uncharacterized protein (DUF302 family)